MHNTNIYVVSYPRSTRICMHCIWVPLWNALIHSFTPWPHYWLTSIWEGNILPNVRWVTHRALFGIEMWNIRGTERPRETMRDEQTYMKSKLCVHNDSVVRSSFFSHTASIACDTRNSSHLRVPCPSASVPTKASQYEPMLALLDSVPTPFPFRAIDVPMLAAAALYSFSFAPPGAIPRKCISFRLLHFGLDSTFSRPFDRFGCALPICYVYRWLRHRALVYTGISWAPDPDDTEHTTVWLSIWFRWCLCNAIYIPF